MENQAPYLAASEIPEVQPTAEMMRLDKELQLMQTKSQMQFALTPVGQALKQFEVNQRMGQMYAASTIVPAIYQKNQANCAIAVDMAIRMNANPLMVMQNLYIVHGNPAWSSKFLIATINTCGRFQPLRYECNDLQGDDYGYRCYTYAATDRDHAERLDGPWVTWKMVKSEGWDKKNGSKWLTMPDVMFRYRAAAFWQRLYAPEISMGFNTVEEQQDVIDVAYADISRPAAAGADSVSPESPTSSLADLALRNARSHVPAEEPAETQAPAADDSQAAPVNVDTATGEIFPPEEI